MWGRAETVLYEKWTRNIPPPCLVSEFTMCLGPGWEKSKNQNSKATRLWQSSSFYSCPWYSNPKAEPYCEDCLGPMKPGKLTKLVLPLPGITLIERGRWCSHNRNKKTKIKLTHLGTPANDSPPWKRVSEWNIWEIHITKTKLNRPQQDHKLSMV